MAGDDIFADFGIAVDNDSERVRRKIAAGQSDPNIAIQRQQVEPTDQRKTMSGQKMSQRATIELQIRAFFECWRIGGGKYSRGDGGGSPIWKCNADEPDRKGD